MDLQRLRNSEGAWLHVFPGTASEAYDLMRSMQDTNPADTAARWIRGDKCRTKHALFDEFAAALQFPVYFGENWDAFDECLNDLEWLPGRFVSLFISHAHEILDGEPDGEWNVFLQILEAAAREWHRPPAGSDRSPRTFQIVMQADPAHEAELQRRLEAAGATFGFKI